MVYIVLVSLVQIIFRIIFLFHSEGTEYVNAYKKNKRPYIICANHISMLDPIFMVMARGTGRRLTIMGKAELFENPMLAWILGQVGVFPVDRGKGDKAVLEKAINDVKNGQGMLIFPEGTRGSGDEMLKLKSGAFMIAAQTNADIIPCRMIYPTKTNRLRFLGKVVVKYGEPLLIENTQLNLGTKDQIRQAKKDLQDRLDKLLEEYNEHN